MENYVSVNLAAFDYWVLKNLIENLECSELNETETKFFMDLVEELTKR